MFFASSYTRSIGATGRVIEVHVDSAYLDTECLNRGCCSGLWVRDLWLRVIGRFW